MFEFDQKIVNDLLNENRNFTRLHHRHELLERRLEDAYDRPTSIDDMALARMKKQKLQIKDRMAALIEDRKHRQ